MGDSVDERSLFIAAVQIDDAAERSAYLDHACGEDVGVRQRLDALLAAHVQAGSFLAGPAVTTNLAATIDQPIVERLGALIGRYKLLEQIGEGGFGIVFMAEQQEPVRRKVALKVLKPGMDTRQVVARFEAERQALALMDHPNIAHVFDGGTTAAGRPYFVMDLVKGVPITEYCDQNQIAPRERLELFVQVCEAVQHAHQKGIIHRDIKPSNVLISRHDGTPVVKVIDFGIAKALGQQLTEKTLFTNFAQLIGTPLYMSPEQAGMSDLDVDTRSDIYSLGVLLYELLTGTTPFDARRFKDAGFDEMRRIIREEEPPKPSARISTVGRAAETVSANRQSDPKQLSRLFRGELDWIVMKALEKDRDRRYETANGLAMDVKRYLRDEPVLACPPSAAYRFRKFARRKKAALAMAACVLLAFSGIAGSVGWAVRDQGARDEASKADRLAREKAIDEAVERSLDETGPLIEEGRWPEALAILERMEHLLAAAARSDRPARLVELTQAVTIAQRLEAIYRSARHEVAPRVLLPAAQTTGGEAVMRENAYDQASFWGWQQNTSFAKAFQDLGIDVDILFPVEAAEKIRQQQIRAALVRALDGWASLRKRSQGDDDSGWKKLLQIARGADPDVWRNRCRDALLKGDRLALEELAEAVPIRQMLPENIYLLGQTLRDVGAADKAMTLLERAQHEYPGDLWINDALAAFSWSACQPPRWDRALRYYTAVLALRPDFAPIHVAVADVLKAKGETQDSLLEYSKALELEHDNVSTWSKRSDAYRLLSRYDEAIADATKAAEIVARHHEQKNRGSQTDDWVLAQDLESLARLLNDLGQTEDAERRYREANTIWHQLAGWSNSEDYRFHLALNYDTLGIFLSQHGRADEALASYRAAHAIWEKLVAEFNREDRRRHLAWTNEALGDLASTAGHLDDATIAYHQATEVWRKLADDFPQNSEYRHNHSHRLLVLANQYANQGHFEESRQMLMNAVEKWPNHAAAWRVCGEQFAQWGLLPEAAADFARAYELEQPPDSMACMKHALLRAYVGDLPGYQDACRPMVARFTDSTNPEDWNHVAQMFTIVPESQANPSQAVELAERAVADKKRVWRVAYLGLALFRAKEFQRAAAALEESLAIDADWNPPWVHSALAMTWHQLGSTEQAAAALAKAACARDGRLDYMLARGLGQWPSVWFDNVYADLLYKEAFALVHGSPLPEDARWLVLRARALAAIGRAQESQAEMQQAFALAPNSLMIRLQVLPPASQTDAYARALADLRSFWKEHPQQVPAALLRMAEVQQRWGLDQSNTGLFPAAEALAAAAACYEKLLGQIAGDAQSGKNLGVPATDVDIAWYRHELGYLYIWQGILLRDFGKLPEAEAVLRQGIELHAGLVADVPSRADYKARLAWNQIELARVGKARGDDASAEHSYLDALAIAEEIGVEDGIVALAYDVLGEFYSENGRLAEAVQTRSKAVAVWEKRASETNAADDRRRLAKENQLLARMLAQSGNNEEAIAAYRKARDLWEVLMREQPDSEDCLQCLCESQSELSGTLVSVGRADEALQPLLTIADVAEKRLQDSAEQWRGVREIHKGLAKFYFAAGRIQEGLRAYDLAIELRPQEHAVWGRRGEFYLRLGLWDRAAHDIAMDCRLGAAANPHQWLVHALLSLESGDAAEYREICRRLPEIFKTPADCAGVDNELVRACCIAETPDVDLAWALRISESAVERSPHAAWEQFALGLARHRAGDNEGAVAALSKSTAWQAGCLSHPAMALAYHRLGREQEAREALDRAAEAINRLAENHLWTPVGTMPMFPHDWLSSLLLYREAVTIIEDRDPPEDFRQLAAQGRSWAALGETKAAEEACRRALDIGAENFLVCLACAMTHAELGQGSEAEAALVAAGRLKPNSAQNLSLLGFVAQKLGKPSEAIDAYAKVIEMEPTDAQAHNNLAWLYATCPMFNLRDSTKAVALAKKAVELKPTEAFAWNTLGVGQYRAGDWNAAVEALGKSMELSNGGNACDWFFLAMARWQQGDKDEARTVFERAIEWMDKNQSTDEELRRFRAEAEELLAKQTNVAAGEPNESQRNDGS